MTRSRIPTCLAGALLAILATDAAAFKCMPLYGNWCGVGHPSHGFPPPVDAFDAACMRHDLCTGAPGSETACDIAFVTELHAIAAQVGYLPRPLQWAEYAIRVKSGGPWGGMPMPTPWDAFGAMSSVAAPCW
ncbi:hypothetical protein [Thiocystis violascens]|uniref:Phospholipase A2 n=1 Tax=Thiocystis violascens (strain ATCC 17096 / DSM 198 / 6111) TaxID=765911 RepID=I3YAQ1_THIV6|nr:hypothetical protein [Thiocystis violascens]AFL74069.1 hypothetical protein Thivi_2117 [Thiocystis violascens DSM 198]